MKNPVRSTRQLAEALGLSRWTVSRALNGHKGIHPATADRVRQAARHHGFAPSLLARGLRAGRTNLLGVCVPDLVDYFLTEKIMHLQRAAAAHGLDVLLQISEGTAASEQAALERFASMRCRGVVLVAPRLRTRAPDAIPCVRIDALTPASGRSVDTDRAGALAEVARHLHQAGHRRIATVAITGEARYGRQRLEGLARGARALGWKPERHILHFPPPGDGPRWEPFEQHPVTALVALNDRVALRLLRWAQRRGFSVPGDLSIVGFDNAETSSLANPSLTTVDPRPDLLMERAVELLFAPKPKKILIQPELVIRESTGPAPS
jgi:LacI family transcriptional regulator